jgi:hypothetical protein
VGPVDTTPSDGSDSVGEFPSIGKTVGTKEVDGAADGKNVDDMVG